MPNYPNITSQVRLNPTEREFFIDNLLVRVHLIIEMILVDRPCAMGVGTPHNLSRQQVQHQTFERSIQKSMSLTYISGLAVVAEPPAITVRLNPTHRI